MSLVHLMDMLDLLNRCILVKCVKVIPNLLSVFVILFLNGNDVKGDKGKGHIYNCGLQTIHVIFVHLIKVMILFLHFLANNVHVKFSFNCTKVKLGDLVKCNLCKRLF